MTSRRVELGVINPGRVYRVDDGTRISELAARELIDGRSADPSTGS
jgi:hypothetical protein